jgi:hypothetical protein
VYGPLNAVVHHQVVEAWLDQLVGFAPGSDNERLAWAFCLAQLARQTGQRALDIDDARRRLVKNALRGQTVPEAWPRMVEEVVEPQRDEQAQMLGDALPIGLRLAKTEE